MGKGWRDGGTKGRRRRKYRDRETNSGQGKSLRSAGGAEISGFRIQVTEFGFQIRELELQD
jgi:hypothetical protein